MVHVYHAILDILWQMEIALWVQQVEEILNAKKMMEKAIVFSAILDII